MAEPTKIDAPAAETDMAMAESAQSAAAAPAPAPAPTPAAPAAEPEPQTKGPVWPSISDDSPLAALIKKTPELIQEAGYSEVYGIHLDGPSTFHRNLILQKFLRANANDVDKASAQLLATLQWRKAFQPLKTPSETFSRARFGGLGYILTLHDVPESANKTDVACFNIYGAVADKQLTFGDLDGFTRWRVALMEESIAQLDLAAATDPIPDYGHGPDRYQAVQVHDYLDVSFLRQDPYSKKAASAAIELFGKYYPETLSRKFFVNVPVVMGWFYSAMKLVVSRETVKKFTVVAYGKDLAVELGKSVPEVYGGTGGTLAEDKQLKLEG